MWSFVTLNNADNIGNLVHVFIKFKLNKRTLILKINSISPTYSFQLNLTADISIKWIVYLNNNENMHDKLNEFRYVQLLQLHDQKYTTLGF